MRNDGGLLSEKREISFTDRWENICYREKTSPVAGGLPGMKYKEYELQLEPGSKVFVYTDSVPEAMNGRREMFGIDRMMETLNANVTADPETILANIRRAVDGFVGEEEQFYDLTMLCLEYKGNPEQTQDLPLSEIAEE